MTDFVYTTYIKSTPEKVWAALTTPEFTRQYWGNELRSDWKKGSKWKSIRNDDGGVNILGEVLESNPPKRLVISWAEASGDKDDISNVAFDIEAVGDTVRLNVTHNGFKPGSTMPGRISKGWPLVLSNMKSFLETGTCFDIMNLKQCGNAGAKKDAAA